MEPLCLEDRGIIAVSGADARDFLQGLITNDVRQLAPGKALYAALLSPQGKILFDFLLVEGEGALLIDVAREARDALMKKLKPYRLRSKVEIEPRDQLGVFAALQGHPDNRPTAYADRAVSFDDPRHPTLPRRSIGALAEMPAKVGTAEAYHRLRLELGVPEGVDFGFEKIFALDAGLDELHGVSFTKGCYMGQELTARMKHRATTRKRILFAAADAPLPVGVALTVDGQEIGEIQASYGTKAFALVRLDRLAEANGPVMAGEIAVALTRPSWLDPLHGA